MIVKIANAERETDMQEFARDIELEFERLNSKIAKLKAKAEKCGNAFDEEEARRKSVSKMRYSRCFPNDNFSSYNDFESVNNNLENVYNAVCELRK